MKDHFIDDRAVAAKFDDEPLQLDDAEPSTLLRRKAIGRLVIGLQHELAFRIERHAMCGRATSVAADTPRAEGRVGTVASRKTREDDILDHRLERRRETDNVAFAMG